MTLFHYLASAIIVITTIFAQNSVAYNRRCNKEVERVFFLFSWQFANLMSHIIMTTLPHPHAQLRRLACCTHTRHARLDEEATLLVPLYGKIITHTHMHTQRFTSHTHARKLLRGQILIVFVVFCFLFCFASQFSDLPAHNWH